ncbi:MAG: phosphoribosylformylglycinamidine synthase subunit PurS [Gemmatimonadota bacterium]
MYPCRWWTPRRGGIARRITGSRAANCPTSPDTPGEAEIQYAVQVRITPRAEILDPEGETIGRALGTLGYEGVADVRAGRLISMHVEAENEVIARDAVAEMCERLIANPIIEDFSILIEEAD